MNFSFTITEHMILFASLYVCVGLFIVAVHQTIVDDYEKWGPLGFFYWTFFWPLAPLVLIFFLMASNI